MEWMVAMVKVSSPKQLPDVFFLLPDNWEPVVEKLKRLTKYSLGDVYLFETPMGKNTFKIICVEVLL
jgi:hypothetical protein